jgi:hypothetical protein
MERQSYRCPDCGTTEAVFIKSDGRCQHCHELYELREENTRLRAQLAGTLPADVVHLDYHEQVMRGLQDTAAQYKAERDALRGIIDAMVCLSTQFHGKICDKIGWPGCDVCRAKNAARALLAGQEGSGGQANNAPDSA